MFALREQMLFSIQNDPCYQILIGAMFLSSACFYIYVRFIMK